MKKLSFDYSKASQFISQHEVDFMENQVMAMAKILEEKTGAGNDFLGWLDLPINYDKDERNNFV